MQSPLKTVLVYDLETGGLSSKFASITEVAIVAIEQESLEIIEEFSVMIKPYFDITIREKDPMKEIKAIFKMIAVADEETGIKTLLYKNQKVTLKSLKLIEEDMILFNNDYPVTEKTHISYKEYLELLNTDHSDIARMYFGKCYNPQALEVTKISEKMMTEEGVEREVALKMIEDFIKKHSPGNSKPILAGHNIRKFDNPIFEKFFEQIGSDLWKIVNPFIIDTLEWARIRWFELSAYNLGTCANEVGLTLKEAHRALPDTVANAKFLIKMMKSLRGEGAQENKYVRRKFSFNF